MLGLEEVLLTQVSMKNGLTIFDERRADAVLAEMKQLHTMKSLCLVAAKETTAKQRHDTRMYLIYLKEKTNGRINGQGH